MCFCGFHIQPLESSGFQWPSGASGAPLGQCGALGASAPDLLEGSTHWGVLQGTLRVLCNYHTQWFQWLYFNNT